MKAAIELFWSLLALGVMATGLVAMFSPNTARRMAKNLAVSLGLFVLGCLLIQSTCPVWAW